MFTKIRKFIFSATCYLLLATFLVGCATTPTVSLPRIKETFRIGGTQYVSIASLCDAFNADYQWDSIAKKTILKKGDREARIMADSATVLLDNQIHTMDKEARFYRGSLIIPQSFVYKRLGPFFGEEYIGRKAPAAEIYGPIKSVIIDPGHGGKDPGAIGRDGLKEKDVVLDIARRLRRGLNALGINVILTRDSDRFISLAQRSQIANENARNADFFISIHANASRSKWVSGVEVYYLSESIDDNQRSLRASRSFDLNLKEDYLGKYTGAILCDLIFSENRRESIQLARSVSSSLCRQLYQRNRGVKQARFYVLKAYIPAVLVEVGFISNRKEERKLESPSYRDKIAQAIAEGIIEYNRMFGPRHTVRY